MMRMIRKISILREEQIILNTITDMMIDMIADQNSNNNILRTLT